MPGYHPHIHPAHMSELSFLPGSSQTADSVVRNIQAREIASVSAILATFLGSTIHISNIST